MSYNESLGSNSNYPPMSQSQWDSAPFNEVEVPEREFDVTISMSLSRTVQCYTNKYIPEVDEENGHMYVDTSDTPWSEVYGDNHKTIPELLEELKKYIKKDLSNLADDETKIDKAFHRRRLEFLLNECEDWTVDEEDYEGE